MNPEVERCRKEQMRCLDQIFGGVDEKTLRGAIGGLEDWVMEEILMEGEVREVAAACAPRSAPVRALVQTGGL